MKKYKSCTAPIGEWCKKHQCVHKVDIDVSTDIVITTTEKILSTMLQDCPKELWINADNLLILLEEAIENGNISHKKGFSPATFLLFIKKEIEKAKDQQIRVAFPHLFFKGDKK